MNDFSMESSFVKERRKEVGKKSVLGMCSIITLTLLLLVLSLATIVGCKEKSPSEATRKVTITDMAGREVSISVPVSRVAAIGPGALRLVCYAGAADKVVGIEAMEKQWGTGRPYILAQPQLLDLPVIGQGGPDSSPDPEALLNARPEVIFAAYLLDASRANDLQEKTGIPVVVLSYGQLGTFDQELMDSILLIGEITGNQKRGDEVVQYIKDCNEDLKRRTSGIAADRKPTVYAGGIGMKGTHGIESTQANFPPFIAINARNVVDEAGIKGWSVMIDKEQLLKWDPDVLFIDESGLQMVMEDYAKNSGFYNSLKSIRDGKVYGYLPYNYYTTNVDTAIADAYFMGYILYPEAFRDVDPVVKADEIYTFLLGKALYERMASDFGGFKQLNLSAH